jgi:hypothetical protein
VGINDVLSYCNYIKLKFCEGTVHLDVHYKAYSCITDPFSQSGQPLLCPDDQLFRFLDRRSSAAKPLICFPPEMDDELDEAGGVNNKQQQQSTTTTINVNMSCLMLMRLQRRCFAMVLVFKTTTVEHIE